MFAVDDVTVGTSAPVEQLAALAMAGNQQGLQERSRMVTSYTRTLKEMASAAVAGFVKTNSNKSRLQDIQWRFGQ